jgi:hypothetical protein
MVARGCLHHHSRTILARWMVVYTLLGALKIATKERVEDQSQIHPPSCTLRIAHASVNVLEPWRTFWRDLVEHQDHFIPVRYWIGLPAGSYSASVNRR